MKYHDIKRIGPKKKVKQLSAFDKAILGLNYDMKNAHNINIKNKYE